jgi:hypothetical protein
MYARRPNEEYFNPDLQQRRSEDERLTGRYWPGNRIPYPGSPHEAMFFDELAIAFGEVDPALLAREGALRYVRSSRMPGKDDLAPTDIYAIFYYGLGLSLRRLDCTGLPYVLAVYNRSSHDFFLDWTLLVDPPYGQAMVDPVSWRRTIDASPIARLLLTWCAATHIIENYNVPLMLGFSASLAPGAATANPALTASLVNSDTLNRYQKTAIAFANLLAPADRLWQQIAALRLRIHMGDPEWRAHLRAEYGFSGYPGYPGNPGNFGGQGHPGGWQRPDIPGVHPGGMGHPSGMDPVEQLVAILAERNNCPRFLIEPQLDGTTGSGVIDWDSWSLNLLRELPGLKARYVAAERYFHSSMSPFAMPWSAPALGRQPEPVELQVRLSF